MKSIERLTLECWCGIGETAEVDAWAQHELGTNPDPHPNTYDLFGKSPAEATPLLLEIAEHRHDFVPLSPAGERLAIEILIETSEQFLDEAIRPIDFCNVVRWFDGSYLGLHETPDGTVSYPEWLGDLWNACDWCDERWTHGSAPHLIEEARKQLAELRALQTEADRSE